MSKRITFILSIGILGVLFFILSFPLNHWLSQTMPRHQLIQLPLMLVIGLFIGYQNKNINITNLPWGIAILILALFSLMFWMLPRSIDLTVVYPWFNRVMHLHIVGVGFFISLVFRNIMFEVQMAFLLMLSAMLIATGAVLKTFAILLCSSFTIEQQHETGLYLLSFGILLFVVTLFLFFKGLGKVSNQRSSF